MSLAIGDLTASASYNLKIGRPRVQANLIIYQAAVKNAVYEVYRKVPGLGQKRNAGLTYSILAAISFKIVSLGTYIAFPSFISTLQKHRGIHFS
jgi:hypothetical protein